MWNSSFHSQVRDLIVNCVIKLLSSWWTSGIWNELLEPFVKSFVKRTVKQIVYNHMIVSDTINEITYQVYLLSCLY